MKLARKCSCFIKYGIHAGKLLYPHLFRLCHLGIDLDVLQIRVCCVGHTDIPDAQMYKNISTFRSRELMPSGFNYEL
jgi:hypothetical protein